MICDGRRLANRRPSVHFVNFRFKYIKLITPVCHFMNFLSDQSLTISHKYAIRSLISPVFEKKCFKCWKIVEFTDPFLVKSVLGDRYCWRHCSPSEYSVCGCKWRLWCSCWRLSMAKLGYDPSLLPLPPTFLLHHRQIYIRSSTSMGNCPH